MVISYNLFFGIAIDGALDGQAAIDRATSDAQEKTPFLKKLNLEDNNVDVEMGGASSSYQATKVVRTQPRVPESPTCEMITPDEAGNIYLPRGQVINARSFVNEVAITALNQHSINVDRFNYTMYLSII